MTDNRAEAVSEYVSCGPAAHSLYFVLPGSNERGRRSGSLEASHSVPEQPCRCRGGVVRGFPAGVRSLQCTSREEVRYDSEVRDGAHRHPASRKSPKEHQQWCYPSRRSSPAGLPHAAGSPAHARSARNGSRRASSSALDSALQEREHTSRKSEARLRREPPSPGCSM